MTVSRQTELEMARGRAIADRARRESDIARLNACGKVALRVERCGYSVERGVINLVTFVVDGVEVCSERTDEAEYPSDRVMATVNLAIGATVGFDGVPDPPPTHYVSPEAKAYNARMREQNKDRFK